MEEVGLASKLTDQEVKRKALGWQDGSVSKGILSQPPPHTHTYSNKCNKKMGERKTCFCYTEGLGNCQKVK